jgi:hypothetical protein
MLACRIAAVPGLEPVPAPYSKCFDSAISAPETSHAIAAAIAEAKKAKEEGRQKTILLNWSGHGLMDLVGYEKYLQGQLKDVELSEEEVQEGLACMEGLPKPGSARALKTRPRT